MLELRGGTALVTGASGGLGRALARRLAGEGMNVALVARRQELLEEAAGELRAAGVQAEAIAADVSDADALDSILERAERALGPVDLLVNNAGVENIAAFTALTARELREMVDVNLTAPMLLTHRVLPGMLERGRGHVVFVASLAGKVGNPYNEPYSATKAALIALSQSLRIEFAKRPVSFTAVCPGFIAGDGMYQRMKDQGYSSNRLMGETTIDRVVDRTIGAIRSDRPEIIESGSPVRPLLALGQLSPRMVERLVARIGTERLFGGIARERGRL